MQEGRNTIKVCGCGPSQDVSARISFFFALERLTGVQEVDQNSVVRRLAGMQEHQGTTPLWHAGTLQIRRSEVRPRGRFSHT